MAAPRAVGPLAAAAHRALFADPGEVLVGYLAGRCGARLPVYLPLASRLMHLQVVAPTGQAKTSLLAWIAHQDLLSRLTVLTVETAGDLGSRLLSLASRLERPVYRFDPTVPGALKWNPLSGDPETVAERAVTTFRSAASSGKEEFFKNFNAVFLRHAVLALCAWAARGGREPNVRDLWGFLVDDAFRGRVLDTERSPDGRRVTVNAPNLPERTKLWFEKKYFKGWTHRQREEFTSGLHASVEMLLGRGVVEEALCPRDGEQVLRMDEAIDSGGLVLLSVPRGTVGETTARTLSTWLLMDLMQAVRARGEGGRPVAVSVDEAHDMLGHANSEAARVFSGFVTQARRHHAILQLSYQSFSLLPWELRDALDSNARNKMIAGGLGHRDAAEAQAAMGHAEEEVTDTRRTYRGPFSGPGALSVGKRELERPRLSEEEIRHLPRGWWHLSHVKRGRLQPPVLVKAGRAPGSRAGLRSRPEGPELKWNEARPEEVRR